MERGYRQVTAKADPFLDMLRHGNAVISAFKTHRMQNDMAARLLDKDGKLKPFRTWMRDVKDIASHYTVRWLRTEYDTAVLRAHEAAAWRQARQEADVLPNLRWMPTTSASPDVMHKAFWSMKLTLPVNHPFWKKHRPQDRWGCKCSIMQTDEPVTGLKGLEKADRIKPVPGLDNNPADDGMVFGKSHPYVTKAYPGAEEAVEKILGGITVYPPRFDTYYISQKNKNVYISKYHGDDEKEENEKMADFIAKKMDVKVFLLPRLNSNNKDDELKRTELLPKNVYPKKNPDYFINGKLFDFKSMTNIEYTDNFNTQKNKLENRIKKAKEQSDNIVIEVPVWLKRDVIWSTLRNYLNRSNKKRIILIKKGDNLIIDSNIKKQATE